MTQYFGKYRGKVENNIDPMQLGRIQVSVPAVLGEGTLSWAMPCVPYAGSGVGLFVVPPMGANVWVEFEGGDPDYPIWSGCFWGIGEVPAMPAIAEIKVFKTDSITLTLSDLPGAGGLTLEVNPPAVAVPIKIVCDSSGIEISTTPASIKMTPTEIEISHSPATVKVSPASLELTNGAASVKLSPMSVSLNDGALEVM
jgi:hypothetical protein